MIVPQAKHFVSVYNATQQLIVKDIVVFTLKVQSLHVIVAFTVVGHDQVYVHVISLVVGLKDNQDGNQVIL